MYLQDLPRLHILEVHLPLLRVLRQAIDLTLKIRHLMFHELLHRGHDFLDPGDLLGQSIIRESGMLD